MCGSTPPSESSAPEGACDLRRQPGRRQHPVEPGLGLPVHHRRPRPGVVEQVTASLDRETIRTAIAELPLEQRQAIAASPRALIGQPKPEQSPVLLRKVRPQLVDAELHCDRCGVGVQLDRAEQLREPFERVVLRLDGDEHAVGGGERVHGQRAERGRAVEEDVGVLLAPFGQRLGEVAVAVVAAPLAIFFCHSAGPVVCTLVPLASTATVTGMSTTSNS